MRLSVQIILFIFVGLALVSVPAPAHCYGTGVRVYTPSQTTFSADSLPYITNGSFVVFNDGIRDGVYIIRVSVNEPSAINWLDLSETAFTLKPGESKIIFFSFNVSESDALSGEHDFVFMPTLLNMNVEPYLNDFASYVSQTDPFTVKLALPGTLSSSSAEGTPVTFSSDDTRTNLPQSSVLSDNNTVLTQLDRAIRLNSPQQATVGVPATLNVSIFEGLSQQGISLLAVSPNGTLYRVSNSSFTFDREGLWGIMVLVGDEFVLGKPVNVVAQGGVAALLGTTDIGTALAAASLLVLLAVVPIWILAGKRSEATDPYSDILFKTYVVRKYIGQFDKRRLNRIVQVLKSEYYELVAKGAKGKKAEAKSSIEELGTLASLE
jgi:hypothetical protein